jgi:hypothetical protein
MPCGTRTLSGRPLLEVSQTWRLVSRRGIYAMPCPAMRSLGDDLIFSYRFNITSSRLLDKWIEKSLKMQ